MRGFLRFAFWLSEERQDAIHVDDIVVHDQIPGDAVSIESQRVRVARVVFVTANFVVAFAAIVALLTLIAFAFLEKKPPNGIENVFFTTLGYYGSLVMSFGTREK